MHTENQISSKHNARFFGLNGEQPSSLFLVTSSIGKIKLTMQTCYSKIRTPLDSVCEKKIVLEALKKDLTL